MRKIIPTILLLSIMPFMALGGSFQDICDINYNESEERCNNAKEGDAFLGCYYSVGVAVAGNICGSCKTSLQRLGNSSIDNFSSIQWGSRGETNNATSCNWQSATCGPGMVFNQYAKNCTFCTEGYQPNTITIKPKASDPGWEFASKTDGDNNTCQDCPDGWSVADNNATCGKKFTLNANGGSFTPTNPTITLTLEDIKTAGKEISGLAKPTRADYTFAGYYLEEYDVNNCGNGQIIDGEGKIAKSYSVTDAATFGDTLYACWKQNGYDIKIFAPDGIHSKLKTCNKTDSTTCKITSKDIEKNDNLLEGFKCSDGTTNPSKYVKVDDWTIRNFGYLPKNSADEDVGDFPYSDEAEQNAMGAGYLYTVYLWCDKCPQGHYCTKESGIVRITPCPAGTTSGQGATQESDCKAKKDTTKFCDKNGCYFLDEVFFSDDYDGPKWYYK